MSLTRVPITMFEPTSGGGSIVGLNNVVSNTNSYVIGSGITTTLDNTSYVNNLSSLGFISSPVLSGRYLYGDGSRLTNIYTAPSAATFSASVSAPAMSGTHYGDGSNLTGVLRSSGDGNINGNVKINNGNLTVFGNISATGTSTFVNAVFTSTSALSVVNTGGGVALWIGGNNNADIASFYDLDQGKEVLHVGGFNPSTQVPYIGINTSSPNKTLTVVGEVSATDAFFGTTGTFYTSLSAPSLSGNGTGLTINADKLLTGTLNNARLSAAATFSSYISAPALSGIHYGDGTFLSNVKDSSKLNLTGGVVTNYLHLGTGSLVISAGDLTLGGSGNITTPGSVAIGGSLVRSKLDLNNKVIAGVQNIRGNADTGAWSLWGGLGTTDTDINGGNIALYGASHSTNPNTVIINSAAGVESAKFNAAGITFSKPLTANSGITISGNLSTNGTVVHGTTTISGNLSTFGSTTLAGNLSSSGSATVATLTALGPVTISGSLSSSGLATLGAATIKGNLSAQGTIASSDLTLNSTAAQEGGQINFARPSDNATSFVLDVYSNAANNNDSRLRIFNAVSTSELMTVLSSGNVGIGTASPGYKLEVNGGTYVGNLTANSSVSFISNNTRIVKNTSDNGLEFFTFNASRMFIADATGNVGIGTVTPGVKLTIVGDVSSNGNVSASSLSGTHYGDGSSLTLNANNITAGTLNNARLSAAATFSSYISAPSLSGTHYGDGSNLSGVIKTQYTPPGIATFTSSVSAPTLYASTINLLDLGTGAKDSNRSWYSVAMSSDGTKQTAVVYNGQIYISSDSGNTWTPKDSNRSWCAVAMSSDGTKQTAVVDNGQVYVSTDSGNTWTPKDSNRAWTTVAMSSDGTKQTAGTYGGLIYISSDSGNTWTPKDSNRYWKDVAMSSDGTKQTAVVYGGQICISTDSGNTWTPKDSSRAWIVVAMSSDGTKQTAAVDNGQIYISTDSGNTWTPKDSNRYWRGIAMSSDGTKLTAVSMNGMGSNGLIYISTDSGNTWTPKDSSRDWFGVAMTSDGTKLTFVVYGGQIYVISLIVTTVISPTLISAPALSGTFYGDGSNLNKLPAIATFTSSVSAPALSGTFYGDGSNLTYSQLNVNGNISATGDIIAYYTSDGRLKKNIIEIPKALEKISTIRGVEYDWDTQLQKLYSGHDVGVIAQEIEEVLPSAVIDRKSGYKAVKYEKIVPLLIQAIKELKAEVEILKSK